MPPACPPLLKPVPRDDRSSKRPVLPGSPSTSRPLPSCAPRAWHTGILLTAGFPKRQRPRFCPRVAGQVVAVSRSTSNTTKVNGTTDDRLHQLKWEEPLRACVVKTPSFATAREQSGGHFVTLVQTKVDVHPVRRCCAAPGLAFGSTSCTSASFRPQRQWRYAGGRSALRRFVSHVAQPVACSAASRPVEGETEEIRRASRSSR